MQIPMGVSNSHMAHGCLVISNSCGVQLKSKNLSVRAAHARVDAAATCEQQLQLQLASCCMWFTQSDVAAILSPTCHRALRATPGRTRDICIGVLSSSQTEWENCCKFHLGSWGRLDIPCTHSRTEEACWVLDDYGMLRTTCSTCSLPTECSQVAQLPWLVPLV